MHDVIFCPYLYKFVSLVFSKNGYPVMQVVNTFVLDEMLIAALWSLAGRY